MPDAPKPRRRRLSARKRALFGVITVVGLLGVAEVFFQAREVVRESRKQRLPLRPDPYRGTELIPSTDYDRPDQNRKAHINALGFRGPEVDLEAPAGTFRIACVGGSTTYGLYTSADDKTWPAQLEARLHEAGRTVQVLNAGNPGWNMNSSLANLELDVLPLKPDMLICFHNYNDLLETSRPHTSAKYVHDAHASSLDEVYDPEPITVFTFSALARFVRSRLREDYDASYTRKATELDEDCMAAYVHNLKRFVTMAREHGATPVLCTFPTAFRETAEASREAKVPAFEEWYDTHGPIDYPVLMEGLRRNNEAVRAVGQELDVLVVDLVAQVEVDNALFMSPIHHSDQGEAEIADLVARALLAADLIPQ